MKAILLLLVLFMTESCEAQFNFFGSHSAVSHVATLGGTYVISVTATTATAGAEVYTDGGSTITERGICWNTSGTPTTSDSKGTAAGTVGAYTVSLSSLTASSTYHVRSYAINGVGTTYGNEVDFTTASAGGTLAVIATNSVTLATFESARSGGFIYSEGTGGVSTKGVCWSTSLNPTIADSKTSNGSGGASYSSDMTGLTMATTYHVRAYATNSVGTAYGADIIFNTYGVLTLTPQNIGYMSKENILWWSPYRNTDTGATYISVGSLWIDVAKGILLYTGTRGEMIFDAGAYPADMNVDSILLKLYNISDSYNTTPVGIAVTRAPNVNCASTTDWGYIANGFIPVLDFKYINIRSAGWTTFRLGTTFSINTYYGGKHMSYGVMNYDWDWWGIPIPASNSYQVSFSPSGGTAPQLLIYYSKKYVAPPVE